MDVEIHVECSITGNQAEYEYDIDENTLMDFIRDVNGESPSLGFPSRTYDEEVGVLVDGSPHKFFHNASRTLAELGVKDGSLIIIFEELSHAHWDGNVCIVPDCNTLLPEGHGAFCSKECESSFFDVPTTGDAQVSSRSKLKRKIKRALNKKERPELKKKPPRVLKKIDPNSMTNLELLKAAALNEVDLGGVATSIQQLKDKLRHMVRSGKRITFSLPKKFRKKSYNTPLGTIKYSHILLWCDGTKDLDLSTIHLRNACAELFGDADIDEDIVGEKVLRLVNTRCQSPGCNGTFRLWNMKDNPPKYVR